MAPAAKPRPTACLALADGSVFYGKGFGAVGETVAELCFNTAMTGYQEIMTDPSYACQIVTFTFPHIGNTGITSEDDETVDPFAYEAYYQFQVNDSVTMTPTIFGGTDRNGTSGGDVFGALVNTTFKF